MTAEYTKKTKQPDYALASYRLPYKNVSGYLEEEEEEEPKTPEIEDRYKTKGAYLLLEYKEMEVVSVRLVKYKVKLRKMI